MAQVGRRKRNVIPTTVTPPHKPWGRRGETGFSSYETIPFSRGPSRPHCPDCGSGVPGEGDARRRRGFHSLPAHPAAPSPHKNVCSWGHNSFEKPGTKTLKFKVVCGLFVFAFSFVFVGVDDSQMPRVGALMVKLKSSPFLPSFSSYWTGG